jgi:hypothetical protein
MPSHPTPRDPAVLAAVVASAALIAQQVAGRATRDALFLSSFPVDALPTVMIGSAVLAIVAVLAFSKLLAVSSPARVVPAAASLSAILLLAEWGLSLVAPRAAAVAVYLHLAVFGAPLISGFWSLVNERFDPYTARQVVGRIGTGASLGGIAGGLLAWGAADLIDVPSMLVVMAVMSLVGLWGLLELRPPGAARALPGAVEDAGDPLPRTSPLPGLTILREVPYLRDLAVIVALGAAVEALLDYVLNAHAAAVFSPGNELMSFFAAFHAGVSLLSFLVQTAVSRWSLARLGLAGTVALQPAAVALGSLVALLAPRLWSVLLVRGAEAVLHNSLFRSGYELLYTPLPPEKKRPTKAIVDVGFDKLGTVAGAGVALIVIQFSGAPTAILAAVAGAAAAAALAMSERVHRGYVSALAESLRSGAVHLDPAELVDSTTRLTLAQTNMTLDRDTLLKQIQALRETGGHGEAAPSAVEEPRDVHVDSLLRSIAELRSGQPELVRRVAARPEAESPHLVSHWIPLLARNDLFLDVLRVLRRLAPRVTGQLADALLDPREQLAVRRRLPRVLKACTTQRAADGLVAGLADDAFEVRYQCGLALTRIVEHDPKVRVRSEDVFAAARRELASLPAEPVRSHGREARVLEHVFTLLALALPRAPLQVSYLALTGDDAALRGTALEYLENVLPDDLREALWPRLGVTGRPAPRSRAHPEVLDRMVRTMSALFGPRAVRRGPRSARD